MSVVERGRVFSGRYRVVGILGDGGMARVYKAVDERLGRAVAVKALHDYYNSQSAFVARFEQEARLAAGLNHPNIVGVYDIERDDDGHYIVMEYVEGETLKRLVEREAPLALPAATAILRQICLALDYAHARGVVHRDVKPENIFLTPERVVKVGDFGIARALDASTLTPAGMVLGSVSYLAPEQALGQKTTAQSDLYATGVVLYELLTGRLPFVAENALGVAMMHLNEDPAPPSRHNPALPPAVDTVVLTALAKDPARRYRTGADLVDALARAAITAGETTTVTSSTPPPAPEATAPLPGVAMPTPAPATRLLDMRPPEQGPMGARHVQERITAPTTNSSGASTTHRLDDGTWASLPVARGGAPRNMTPPAAAPARVGPPARRWRALIPLAIPLLAVLIVAGAVKAVTGGQGQDRRYGVGSASIPTATAASARSTATAPNRRVVVPAAAPTATPRHTVAGSRHYAHRGRPKQARRSPTPSPPPGNSGGAADNGGIYSYATATAEPTDAPATIAPAAPPVVVQPTATDAPAYAAPRATPARAAPTWTPRPRATDTAPPATDTPLQGLPSATSVPDQTAGATPTTPAQGVDSTPTTGPQDNGGAPTTAAGDAAPTTVPTAAPPLDTPIEIATDVPPTAGPTTVPTMAGDEGAPSSLHLNNVAVSTQALAAVYHANDVYMQVMNDRDASGVYTAFGPGLASYNQGMAATLKTNHQHWRINLVNMGLSNAQVIDANTVHVTVTKTENAELLSDSGRIIKAPYTDTETFVDIVQRIDGAWLVTQVYH